MGTEPSHCDGGPLSFVDPNTPINRQRQLKSPNTMRTTDYALTPIPDVEHSPASEAKRIRIAFLSMRDPHDRRSWSGTTYFMVEALQKHCGDVVCVGPFENFSTKVGKIAQKALRITTGLNYLYTHTSGLSRRLGREASKALSEISCDVIFAPAGSTLLAHLETGVPIVYLSDATLRLVIDYYTDFRNCLRSHVRMAEQFETSAISRATELVYPSSWAAQSAVRDYGADPSKVHVIPFGANMEATPATRQSSKRSIKSSCELLFVGVDWQRKGGEIAVETVQALQELGVAAKLTVIGCRPPSGRRYTNVDFIPFINKNAPEGRARLESLYTEADFFLLPTRAECFGIALCEANAYGLPVLATRTGGVEEIVREGVNGFLFPLEARGDQYAARIKEVLGDAEGYQRLRVSSRDQFETRLNWDAWGKSMNTILWNAVTAHESRQASDKEHAIQR